MNPAGRPPAWLKELKTQCTAESDADRTGKKWSLFLLPEQMATAARRLYEKGFFLEDITGMDTKDGLVAVYHFDHFTRPGRVALHVIVPHEQPDIPSISTIFSGAQWHEREAADFFGFVFTGHPDPGPLLLPEDMEIHPLLKDEGARLPLDGLLQLGKIVERAPDFEFFRKTETPDQEEGKR